MTTNEKPNWQKNIVIVLALATMSFILLSPLNNDGSFLLADSDFGNHLDLLFSAKSVFKQSRLLSSMPDAVGGGLAQFQFYGFLTYSLGALLLKHFHSLSTWDVFKILCWLSSWLGGIYVFRIVNWLLRCRKIALLAGFVYQCSPYLIINMTQRGDLTEFFAQGLIAVAIYYSLLVFFENFNWRNFLLMAFAWVSVLTSSIVVFMYTALFLGAFFTAFLFFDVKYIKKLLLSGLVLLLVFSLTAWYIIPIMLFKYKLLVSLDYPNPFFNRYLTELNSLLSLFPTSGASVSNKVPYFFQIGWPVLFGGVGCIYALWASNISSVTMVNRFAKLLSIFFLITVFITWSPINFWYYLPRFLYIEQFSYRMLTQVTWIGAICFAIALKWLLKDKIELPQFLICLFLICFSTHMWLSQKSELIKYVPKKYGSIMGHYYDMRPDSFKTEKNFFPKTQTEKFCYFVKDIMYCKLSIKKPGYYQLPFHYYPNMIHIKINNVKTPYVATPYIFNQSVFGGREFLLVGIYLNPGDYYVKSIFTGIAWANWVSAITWLLIFSIVTISLSMKIFSLSKKRILNKLYETS